MFTKNKSTCQVTCFSVFSQLIFSLEIQLETKMKCFNFRNQWFMSDTMIGMPNVDMIDLHPIFGAYKSNILNLIEVKT